VICFFLSGIEQSGGGLDSLHEIGEVIISRYVKNTSSDRCFVEFSSESAFLSSASLRIEEYADVSVER
jgi:hypothetical protein